MFPLDKDTDTIIRFLATKESASFQEIMRKIGCIARKTLYKKLKLLMDENIIICIDNKEESSRTGWLDGKSYFLGEKIEDFDLYADNLFSKIRVEIDSTEYRKMRIKVLGKAIKKNLVKAPVKLSF